MYIVHDIFTKTEMNIEGSVNFFNIVLLSFSNYSYKFSRNRFKP